jgi:hypothetical protein
MKKQGNCQKWFAFVVGSCVCFQSFGVHSSMSRECNWKTTTNNKGLGSIEEWAHVKAGGGRWIVDKNWSRRAIKKSRKRSVEYLAFGCKVVATFIIIFGMCRREGV